MQSRSNRLINNKLKKQTLLLLALAAVATASTEARTLSPAEALARAANQPQAAGISRGQAAPAPVMTVGDAQSPALYVFTSGPSGYLVVSADDVAAPVLGYSDSGTFDPDNMPPAMRWWLDEYKAQISAAAQEDAGVYQAVERESRQAVGPLLKTKWDQGSPYNKYCPIYKEGSQSYPTYTGCVATAMAQVMKYHNWPDKAASSAVFSYDWEAQNKTLTASFSNFAFDWANMLPDYSTATSVTTAQADAVAKLMQACGYSVEMDYGPYESGAPSAAVGGALVNKFKYDPAMRNEVRQCYTLAAWVDMVYNSLKNDGPVLYAGNNSEGGHCFVCDGYRSDGYFHINWGWSGMSDGYFLLDALDPDQQGAGGSTSGYNCSQEILVGIRPLTTSSTVPTDVKFIAMGFITGEISGSNLTVYGDFANYSINSVSGKVSFRVTDMNGNEIKVVDRYNVPGLSPGSYYPSLTIPLSNLGLSDGSYRIYPVFKIGSTVYPFQASISQPGYVVVTRSGSTYSVTTPSLGDYSVTGLTVGPTLYSKNSFLAKGTARFSADIEEAMQPICGLLLNASGKVLGHGDEMNQSFSTAGESFEYFSYWFITDNDTEVSVTPGTYKFAMGYKAGSGYKIISELVDVTVKADPGTPSLQITSWNIENASSVDPDNVVINVNVKCLSGYMAGPLTAVFFGQDSEYADAQLYSPRLVLNAGESADVVIKGSLTGFSTGEIVDVGLYYVMDFISDEYKQFIIGERSGIADVIADGAASVSASPNPTADYTVISASSGISRVDLFSIGGTQTGAPAEIDGTTARVDLSALPSGLYIARVQTAAGVSTVKIIRK